MESEEKWYGVTYKEDKKSVMDAIAAMKVQGTYPENLWKQTDGNRRFTCRDDKEQKKIQECRGILEF